MQSIKERVEGFVQTKPVAVKRNGASYAETEVVVRRVLKICMFAYKRLNSVNQTARLLRDLMDFALRRYHNYCIKENIGGHYREVGVKKGKSKCDFEHVIPAAVARELMIHGRITVEEAMNIPTCMLSKSKHKKLASIGLGSTTPNINNFWERYKDLKIEVETHDGTPVDMKTWDLTKHYDYFK